MEDPRIISALFIFLKMAYYNVLINISFRNTDVYNCIASCQLSYYRCLQLYCILSTFVIQMSTTVLHPVNIRNTDVYNCIASCQLSYYRCLQLYYILSAFVLQMSTIVLHPVSFRITSCLHLYYIMSAFVRQNPIFPSKLPLSVRNSPTGELARYA